MKMREANQEACKRILEARPVWTDVRLARDVIPGMKKNLVLHTGPAIEWERMCRPQKAAITAAMILEGLCDDIDEAEVLIKRGQVELDVNQNHQAVGPMAGPISSSMAVAVVENRTYGNLAFAGPFNTGRKSPVYTGNITTQAIDIQRWLAEVWAPATSQALHQLGGIDGRALAGRALLMGDELHNRNLAATSLFLNEITKGYLMASLPGDVLLEVMTFMQENIEMFWATPHLAVCKAMLDPAQGIENCSIVTNMASNGVEFGIVVSGLGNRYFSAPAPMVKGTYFPGFSDKEANPDLGGSRIKETAGFGGMCIASSPAMGLLLGERMKDIVAQTLQMYEITTVENPAYQIPYLDFRGVPTGIDLIKVVETGITPIIDTAINHREENHPFIGVGITIAPLECFEKALQYLANAKG